MRGLTTLLLLLSGCAAASSPPLRVAEADTELMLALFLDARSIEAQLADDFACAGIEDAGTERDPPAEVTAALGRRLGVPVFPMSQCSLSEESSQVLGPRGTAGEGTWLTIGDIACSNPDRCTATVSYHVANLAAGGRDVVAERTAAGWRITPTGSMWIS